MTDDERLSALLDTLLRCTALGAILTRGHSTKRDADRYLASRKEALEHLRKLLLPFEVD